MRIMRLGPFFAFGLLFSLTAIQAQQAPTPTPASRDVQSVALLQRSLAALTGTARVTDVMLTGSVTRIAGSQNESGTATLKATSAGQGRMDLSLPSGQRSEVTDVSQAGPSGSWSGPDAAWHPVAGHNLYSDLTWFFPAFLISRILSTPTYVVSPSDAETKDGTAVEHFAVYEQAAQASASAKLIESLSRMDIYLDPSTLLPAAIAFNVHPDNDALTNIPTEIRFANYQNVQGVAVPYHIQKYIQNGLVLDVTLSGAQINAGLSGTDFQAQ
ncbi:MAG TPA: hypothetical protein VJP02_15385 [Candidatus Sulfotelmatobacter sp.]|nr:hypothetical protein [Candidatus Sulfotelmatobacter sp.]